MPLGAGNPKARASSVKAAARLFSQSLRIDQTADVPKAFGRRVILQQSAFANDLLFLRENFVDIIAAQPLVFDDDFGEDIFRLAKGQAQRRLQQPLAARFLKFDLDLLEFLDIGNNLVKQRAQILARRQRIVQHVISFSNSVGISTTGEIRMMVLRLSFRCRAISLSLRTTAKLLRVRNG